MHAEAAFLAGYALALVALAAGLERIGRRSANPWRSRVLTASRPPDMADVDLSADWPHSEVPLFHLGVSGVALAAALVLTVANAVRHHRPIELVVILTVLVLIAGWTVRVVRQQRSSVPAQDAPPRP